MTFRYASSGAIVINCRSEWLCGRSTLLKVLCQIASAWTSSSCTKLELLYFDQPRGQLDLDATVSENIADGNDTVIVGKPRHVIGYLKDFLFSPLRARSPVRVLSGGERNRLLLARLFKKSSTFSFHEPTNDLDAEFLELLEAVLLDYQGTVLLVSHDRAFLDNVVTSTILAYDYLSLCGGYADWLRQRFKQSALNDRYRAKAQRSKTGATDHLRGEAELR